MMSCKTAKCPFCFEYKEIVGSLPDGSGEDKDACTECIESFDNWLDQREQENLKAKMDDDEYNDYVISKHESSYEDLVDKIGGPRGEDSNE